MMPQSTPQDMQSVVRIQHRAGHGGNTIAMFIPDPSSGGHSRKNITWYKYNPDDKLIAGHRENVEFAIIPIMEVVTGQQFVMTHETPSGLTIWERVDYLQSKPNPDE